MAMELFQAYPDVLTVEEVQTALRIGKNQAYALIHNNTIKHVKIGRNIKVPKVYLIDFLLGNEYNTACSGGFNLLSRRRT